MTRWFAALAMALTCCATLAKATRVAAQSAPSVGAPFEMDMFRPFPSEQFELGVAQSQNLYSNQRSATNHNNNHIMNMISPNNNLSHHQNQHQHMSHANNHHQSQPHQPLKVNVSNSCERDRMVITIKFAKPFHGLIHAKDKRKRANCLAEGSGLQTYTMEFSYSLSSIDPDYCGLQIVSPNHLTGSNNNAVSATTDTHDDIASTSNHKSRGQSSSSNSNLTMQTLSLVLVVRLHKTMEFSDDRYFLLSCAADRCARADCLSTSTSTSTSSLSRGPQFAATSGQPSTPRPLKMLSAQSSSHLQLNQSQSQTIEPESSRLRLQSSSATSTSACDELLESKFQVLMRLSVVLALLFALVLVVSICLCMYISTSRKHRALPDRRSRKSLEQPASAQVSEAHSRPVAHLLQKSSLLSSANLVGLGVTSKPIDEYQHQHQNQHQHHRQKLFEAPKASDHATSIRVVAASLQKHHHQASSLIIDSSNSTTSGGATSDSGQHLLPGRPFDTFGRQLPARPQPQRPLVQPPEEEERAAVAFARRRRSLGAPSDSDGALRGRKGARESASHAHGTGVAALSAGESQFAPAGEQFRAKSRSQTTIHYEQPLEPFLASAISRGDQHHMHQVSSTNRMAEAADYRLGEYEAEDQHGQVWTQHNHHYQTGNGCVDLHNPLQAKFYLDHNSSQFDPKSNSSQLVELIHEKHRRQLEQASLAMQSMAYQPNHNQPGLHHHHATNVIMIQPAESKW